MGINEKRQQRRSDLFGQFVSVKDLINYLATEESLGIDEVAAELETAFIRTTTADSDIPEYGYVDEPSISFVPYSASQRSEHLAGILSDTIMLGTHGATDDHHGWLRDDLFPFLQSHGLDAPLHLPPWEPSVNETVERNFCESAEQRRSRIIKSVDENKAKGIPKTKSYETLGAAETVPCTAGNIRRIYRGR